MKPLPRVSASKYPTPVIKGLGDVVPLVAQPIAKVVDSVAGTSIQTCGGCAQRRAALNQKFPFSIKP